MELIIPVLIALFLIILIGFFAVVALSKKRHRKQGLISTVANEVQQAEKSDNIPYMYDPVLNAYVLPETPTSIKPVASSANVPVADPIEMSQNKVPQQVENVNAKVDNVNQKVEALNQKLDAVANAVINK